MTTNSKHRVVIIGGGSMIASRIKNKLNCHIITTSSKNISADYLLDLRDFQEKDVNFIKQNDIVIIAAGISSPDKCEHEYENAKSINLIGTTRLIKYCLDISAKVIFLSSDSVYGNTTYDKPALETMPLMPIGNYAEMKAEIEESFQNREGFIALRLSYVLSRSDKFTQYLCSCSLSKKNAEIFHPLYRNVVWIEDLVSLCSSFLDEWPLTNSINVGGPDLTSRLDIANTIKAVSNLEFNCTVIEPQEIFYKARPKEIKLNIDIFTKYLGRIPYNIKVAYEKEFKLQL